MKCVCGDSPLIKCVCWKAGKVIMSCYFPLKAYRSAIDGKIYFKDCASSDLISLNQWEPIQLPCGQCLGCRLERSRKWAVRCMLEASLHEQNCFLTLTYAPEHLPENGSLVKRDLTLFFKRLRKTYGEGIRYFACGEYGERFDRPHYHVILFGFIPEDYQPCKVSSVCFSRLFPSSSSSSPLSLLQGLSKQLSDGLTGIDTPEVRFSPSLTRIWGKGHVAIGECTFESCAYVARYCLKKVNGPDAEEHYQGRTPEYIVMSRRPGIAFDWFMKYSSDVYPNDFLFARGHKCKPPRYFDNLLKSADEDLYTSVKAIREKSINLSDSTPERLAVKREVALLNMKKISRKYEKNT